MTKRMLIMIGAVIVLIAALAGGKYLQIKKLIASIPKPQPQTVSTIEVQAQPWQSQLKSVGTLSPVRGADLASEVAGLVRPTWTEGHTLMLNLHVVTCLIVTMHSLLKTEQWSCTKRYITRMHNI